MRTFPDFGKELSRPFEVDQRCFDCAELYHGCNATPENPDAYCPDYLRLPDVGVNGKTGQEFPPSRMGDRKEPRIRSAAGAPVRVQVQPKNPPPRCQAPAEPEPIEQTRQQSPAASPGPDGERLCGCGTVLKKRERCCGACRLSRRQKTMRRRRIGKRPSLVAVQSDPGVPFPAPGRPSTPCRSGAHN